MRGFARLRPAAAGVVLNLWFILLNQPIRIDIP